MGRPRMRRVGPPPSSSSADEAAASSSVFWAKLTSPFNIWSGTNFVRLGDEFRDEFQAIGFFCVWKIANDSYMKNLRIEVALDEIHTRSKYQHGRGVSDLTRPTRSGCGQVTVQLSRGEVPIIRRA
mmetsp:Transcript_33972/g.101429  ORF Transcript_33972/g.101429 Transcript_33972/m.101429 type:complete len:126 (+) Transcript_33972:1202-1579(+)